MHLASELRIIETLDGSFTLANALLGLTYRSDQGAQGETDHVFIQSSGLLAIQEEWQVFELGFGGGRNCLQTLEAFVNAPGVHRLNYVSVENNLIDVSIFKQMYEASPLSAFVPHVTPVLAHTPAMKAYTQGQLAPQKEISITIYKDHWKNVPVGVVLADAIFHDPFGPQDNPEAWTSECFLWQASQLKPQGRLVTYSAASAVRRAMQASGLSVASAPGFGRKREMTLASKKASSLLGFSLWKPRSSEGIL
jgi:tRNA U34 5-methylaminomethyl-2-thiouridine-forming methyltransferase MnmC